MATTRYAFVRPDNTIDRFASDIDPKVQTKPGYRWLPSPPVVKPSFDPLTETIDGPAYTVGASAVTESWTKRSLAAQEISDRKDAAINDLGAGYGPMLKVLFNLNNRVRVLEGQAALTLAQFKAAIKAQI